MGPVRIMNLERAFLAVLSAAFVAGASAASAAPYGMAGCGLGSMVLKEDGFMQVFAATINGTSASQTFGITTGTSNCTRSGVVLADREQEAFFEANFAELRRDIAAGGGEYLSALTQLFACEPSVQKDVSELAQARFAAVFPHEKTTPQQALYLLKLELSQRESIARACSL